MIAADDGADGVASSRAQRHAEHAEAAACQHGAAPHPRHVDGQVVHTLGGEHGHPDGNGQTKGDGPGRGTEPSGRHQFGNDDAAARRGSAR